MEEKLTLDKALDFLVTKYKLEDISEYLLVSYSKAVLGDLLIFFYDNLREELGVNISLWDREIKDDCLWITTLFRDYLTRTIDSYIEEGIG